MVSSPDSDTASEGPPAEVSVVLATYEGSRYLVDQLASLTRQSLPPAEVIIADDHSTDATVEIARSFQREAHFPVVIVERQERLGFADNFLEAALRATSPIVAFCDQDDVWDVDKLRTTVNCFRRHANVSVVAHHCRVITADGRRLGRVYPAPKQAGLYRGSSLPIDQYPGMALAVRSELLRAAKWQQRPSASHGRPGRLAHDAWVWLLAACVGETLIISDELVSYRQHSNLYGDDHISALEWLRRVRAADSQVLALRAEEQFRFARYLDALAADWASAGQHAWSQEARARGAQFRDLGCRAARRSELYCSTTYKSAWRSWRALAWDQGHLRQNGLLRSFRDLLFAMGYVARRRATAAKS